METSKIACPACGAQIDLVPKEGNPYRLVAYHKCSGQDYRQVYETDSPDWPPPLLRDRIEPSEHLPIRRKRSK